jgi:hypothetical protein
LKILFWEEQGHGGLESSRDVNIAGGGLGCRSGEQLEIMKHEQGRYCKVCGGSRYVSMAGEIAFARGAGEQIKWYCS